MIADRIRLPLAEIGRRFRDVDAVANAWFARARLAMLALPTEDFAGRPADERIALAFGAWLKPGPASPGRGRGPAPQALSLPFAPLGAAGFDLSRWCTKCWTWRGCLVPGRLPPGPGDRLDRDHTSHLGGLAPQRQSRPGAKQALPPAAPGPRRAARAVGATIGGDG